MLDDGGIDRRCPDGWRRKGNETVRVYPFDGHPDGVSFATRVAEVADEGFHHPEIVARHDEVEGRLTSHDVGSVTDADIRLASLFDAER